MKIKCSARWVVGMRLAGPGAMLAQVAGHGEAGIGQASARLAGHGPECHRLADGGSTIDGLSLGDITLPKR